MPFRRFFDKSARKPAEPEADLETDAEEPERGDDDNFEVEDVPPESMDEIDWRRRANAVLPVGTSTGSKRMEALYGSADVDAPTHFRRAILRLLWVFGISTRPNISIARWRSAPSRWGMRSRTSRASSWRRSRTDIFPGSHRCSRWMWRSGCARSFRARRWCSLSKRAPRRRRRRCGSRGRTLGAIM